MFNILTSHKISTVFISQAGLYQKIMWSHQQKLTIFVLYNANLDSRIIYQKHFIVRIDLYYTYDSNIWKQWLQNVGINLESHHVLFVLKCWHTTKFQFFWYLRLARIAHLFDHIFNSVLMYNTNDSNILHNAKTTN